MDPTAALESARGALRRYRRATSGEHNPATEHSARLSAETLADAFSALDEWLSRGGFLPQQWSDTRHEVVK